MKQTTKFNLSLLLLTCVALANPAYARKGADDVTPEAPESAADDHGGGHEAGDDHPKAASGNVRNAKSGVVKGRFTSLIDTATVKGSLKHVVKKAGDKQDFVIKLKVGKSGPITAENFDTAVVRAIFPDDSVCELEADDTVGRFYEYALKLRVRKGEFDEKDGSCDSAAIPDYSGGAVVIELDEDDDTGTANQAIASGSF
ncbi:hypothetical protein [Methylomonas rhizoryzae]|uniref:hypothetical protein n=1 Tax=Methylomonas rhizoryzae TaxID=2608981 RepID=UPI001231CA6E|nr:hypothetical protein [Methylomonas rhizoryzae]